jgi:uncharacterized Zn-binding protein involved in type VI secretion
MPGLARLATVSSHGGMVIQGSPNVFGCGIPLSTLGHLHSCPIEGHGVTPIVTASPNVFTNGLGNARLGDVAGCGAVLIGVCPIVTAN